MANNNRLIRLQIKVRPKGLHKSLTPDPWPLIPALSTLVESALQIRLFMQNKPNFRKSQMNVNKVLTKDYENVTLGKRGKNKPNSKPIQTQSNPIKANIMPKQTQYKAKQSQFHRQKMLPKAQPGVIVEAQIRHYKKLCEREQLWQINS